MALEDQAHAHHGAARAALSAGPITVTRGTLVEFTSVIRRVAKDRGLDGNKVARDALRRLRTHPSYRPAQDVKEDAIAAIYAERASLSFVDAWNIAASHECGEELLSFDREMQKAAKHFQL